MVNRRGTLSCWQHLHVNPVLYVCCSIVLHPFVYCSLKYFSSASPASSQVLPLRFLHLLACCPFCLWFCQLSSEAHHSTSQSKLLCLFLRSLLHPVDMSVPAFLCLFFCAKHGVFCGQIRLVLSLTPVYFVLYQTQ